MPDHDAAAPAPQGPALPRVRGRRRALEGALALALLVGSVVLARSTVAGPVRISSGSMEPTLFAGDVVLVDRRQGARDDLARGDLATFRNPLTGEEMLKRVIALPGDSVATIDAVVHVNDEPVEEPYVDFSDWEGVFNARVVVPEGHLYVLGDNRGASVDSRDFGPVPAGAFDGRVLVRLWPPLRLGAEDPPALSP